MASSTVMAIPPRKAIDVPFGRNYVPTWAFDHQKQINGGSELQLILDKYTGTYIHYYEIYDPKHRQNKS